MSEACRLALELVEQPGDLAGCDLKRLAEFARVNPRLPVIALPEGAWLRVSDSTLELCGPHPATLFYRENAPRTLMPGTLPPRFGDTA